MSQKDEKPDLVWREFNKLKPHPMNSNTHPKEQIDSMASMLERLGDGKIQISVQKSTGLVMTGHGLIKSMKQEGHTGAWVIEKDYDDSTALTWMEADNQYQKLSVIDKPTQLANLVELKRIDVELQPLGFELKAIETLKREVDNRVITEDDPPEVSEEEPITETGDLWHLGAHRVLCGDSTQAEDVERVMDGEKADMVFTDPPYGMDLDTDWSDCIGSIGRKNMTKGNKYEPVIGDDQPFEPSHLFEIECGEMFLFGADYYAERIPQRDKGSWLVWDKRKESQSDAIGCEFELIWSKIKHKRRMLRHDWFGFLSSGNQSDARNRVHPTQKPVSLCADIMTQWGSVDNIVYDPYLGSGTTLIAADQLDRVCYGLEIAPKYCDVIVKRYIAHRESSEDVWVERGTDRIAWEQITRSVKVI